MPTCRECEKTFKGKTCPACGWEVGKEKTCGCGAPLLASGRCSDTGEYPSSGRCPIVCPACRGALQWDGGCFRCHGSPETQREGWAFPGSRYGRHGHHMLPIDGSRRACSHEENTRAHALVQAVLSREMDVATALGALDEVMEAHGGIPWDFTRCRETTNEVKEPGSDG